MFLHAKYNKKAMKFNLDQLHLTSFYINKAEIYLLAFVKKIKKKHYGSFEWSKAFDVNSIQLQKTTLVNF